MPNPSGVPITFGGQTRILRLTTAAFVRMEEIWDITLAQAGLGLQSGSLKARCALLWAGLLHQNPKLSAADIYGWIDDDPQALAGLNGVLAEAVMRALGKDPKEKTGDPPAEPPEGPPEGGGADGPPADEKQPGEPVQPTT